MLGICFAIPAYDGRFPIESTVHLAQAVSSLQKAGIPIDIQWGSYSSLIDLCRNRLVKKFLEQSDAQKLFFIDSDIIFKAEDILRLVEASQRHLIVGATYPTKTKESKFFVHAKNSSFEMNEEGLIDTRGFGAGFVVIDRDVFKALDPFTETIVTGPDGVEQLKDYFQISRKDGHYFGEDIFFFKRWADEFDGQVMLDPFINLRHVGVYEYDAKFLEYIDNKLERQ